YVHKLLARGAFKDPYHVWPMDVDYKIVRLPSAFRRKPASIRVDRYTNRTLIATLAMLESASVCIKNQYLVAPKTWPVPSHDPDAASLHTRAATPSDRYEPFDPDFSAPLRAAFGTVVAYALLELFPVNMSGNDAPLFDIPVDDAADIERFRRELPPYFTA